MKMMNTSRPYVTDVRKDEVVVRGLGAPPPAWLGQYNVQPNAEGEYRVPAAGDAQAALLQTLRDQGVAFAGGAHGWTPAEVFADMRERGLLHGAFDEVVFNRPGAVTIRSR